MIGSFAAAAEPTGIQLSLGLADVPPRAVVRRRSRARFRPHPPVHMMSPLTAQFKQRLAATGTSVATQKAYPFQIQQLLAAARRLGLSDRDGPAELFRDEALLGRAMIDDRSCTGGTLSRWTLAQRRAAVRSFARLMAPELRPVLGGHPEAVVMRALRRVAERIGGGFRLGGGKPRHRGGPAPTSAEIAAIIAVAATAPGFKGKRNRAFFTLLHETGSRVNALRELRGDDFVALPNGRLRLMLHAKGRKERREVEPSVQAAEMLLDYIETFNREAVVEGSRERIAVGEAGPVWRGSWRGQWAYQGVAQTFERACVAAGAHAYRLHSLRRAFATDAESQLPRFVVARAGGWQGLDRLDNHYIRPRGQAIRRKLGWNEREDDPASDRERATGAV